MKPSTKGEFMTTTLTKVVVPVAYLAAAYVAGALIERGIKTVFAKS